MKALLFALLLVAFLFKDPVKSLQCYSCGRNGCRDIVTCSEKQEFCFNRFGKRNQLRKSGCAVKCNPRSSSNFRVECCTTDLCN